jgi:hypothetical protein
VLQGGDILSGSGERWGQFVRGMCKKVWERVRERCERGDEGARNVCLAVLQGEDIVSGSGERRALSK